MGEAGTTVGTSVGESMSVLLGLLFIVLFLVIPVVVVAAGVLAHLSDAVGALRSWSGAYSRRRAKTREEAAWAAEKLALEAEPLVARLDEPSDILAAVANGDLLVSGHRDGTVRLRSLSRGSEEVAGGFSTGYGEGVWAVAVSPGGRFVAASDRYGSKVEVRRADGAFLGITAQGPSEALRAWDATADDMEGYLFLNNSLAGFAFGPGGEAVGETTLAVAWELVYGPDGRTLFTVEPKGVKVWRVRTSSGVGL